MFSFEIAILGLALAIDAGVASFAIGILSLLLHSKERWKRGIILACLFGLFQFGMLWLGSYGGFLFSFSSRGHLFQLIVPMIFVLMGIKLMKDSMLTEQKEFNWGFLPVIVLSVATSLDALAVGVSLATLPSPHIHALFVGMITTIVCASFYSLSNFFRTLPTKWLLRLAGLIFFFLGKDLVPQLIGAFRAT